MRCIIFLTALFALTAAMTAHGAYIHVPSDYPNIQDAVSAALNGDTIVLADGTYTGTGNYQISFQGKAITLTSNNGPSNCVIDAEYSGQVFEFTSGEGPSAVVSGVTVTGGIGLLGGGFSCINTSPTITRNIIIENQTSSRGGGVYLSDSNAIITGNLFINNTSASRGGAIYAINGTPQITDNIVSNNSADSRGGAVYFYTTSPVITNNLFENNYSGSRGGGFYLYESHPTFINCTFANNTAVDDGGACYGYLSSPEFLNCIIWGNQSPVGSQMTFSVGSATVSYSDVQGGWTGNENLNTDPLFATGNFGNFYLSQVLAGQETDSGCLNAGNNLASSICFQVAMGTACLDQYTTRTDNIEDGDQVDMGFHYPLPLTETPTPIPTNTPNPTVTPNPTFSPGPPTETPTETPIPSLTPTPTPLITAGDVVINEIMYDTPSNPEEEWVELFNRTSSDINLSGWCLCDDDTFPSLSGEGYLLIPEGVTIPAHSYVVIAESPCAAIECETICTEIGTFDLSNNGESLSLWAGNSGTNLLVDGSLIGPEYPDLCPNNAGTSIEKCPEDAPWPGPLGWKESSNGQTGCFPNACSTPTAIPSETPTPSTGTLTGFVTLERPGTTPPHSSWSVTLIITLCSGGNLIDSYPAISDENGYFSVDVIPGVYDILIKNTHSLASRTDSITILPGEITGPIDFGTLSEGDASNDNAVISDDFLILRNTYNLSAGSPGYDDRADFNEDDAVTSTDLFLLRNHYNTIGPDCATP